MTGSVPPREGTKADLRRAIRLARERSGPRERIEAARGLAAVAATVPLLATARCVAAYASRPDEPGTDLLRAALRAAGTRVLLPVVSDATTLAWAVDDGTTVQAGALRLPEPPGERLGLEALGDADAVLVPALAVDTCGRRLGQGRGYYDRALAALDPSVPVIAVVHDGELLDAAASPVPAEPHDVPVDAVLTPTRYVPLPHPR